MAQESDFISLKAATQYCDYSQEYLSLRARQKKLKAVKLGRNWATTREWLREYSKKSEEYKKGVYGNRVSRELSATRCCPATGVSAKTPVCLRYFARYLIVCGKCFSRPRADGARSSFLGFRDIWRGSWPDYGRVCGLAR